jgi:hypothetical protein
MDFSAGPDIAYFWGIFALPESGSKPSLLGIGILFKSFHTNMALLAIGSKTHMEILLKSFHTNQALARYWVQDQCLVPRPMFGTRGQWYRRRGSKDRPFHNLPFLSS